MTIVTLILLLVFLVLGFVYLALQIIAAKFPKAQMFNRDIFAVMCVAMLVPACFMLVISFLSFCYLFPAYVFYDTFNFAVPAGISELKGRRTIIDQDQTWLEFHAEKQTVPRILTTNYISSEKGKYNPDNPIFNDFIERHKAKIYRNFRNDEEYYPIKSWIAYDETDGEIFYYRIASNSENYQ